jgi:hypothetical protein
MFGFQNSPDFWNAEVTLSLNWNSIASVRLFIIATVSFAKNVLIV